MLKGRCAESLSQWHYIGSTLLETNASQPPLILNMYYMHCTPYLRTRPVEQRDGVVQTVTFNGREKGGEGRRQHKEAARRAGRAWGNICPDSLIYCPFGGVWTTSSDKTEPVPPARQPPTRRRRVTQGLHVSPTVF